MKSLSKWQCWIRAIINSIQIGHKCSGHSWKDEEERTGCNVTLSKCEVCDKYDISWSGGRTKDKKYE